MLVLLPVGEVAVALLVLPAPLCEVDEVDWAELLLLPPKAPLGVEMLEMLAVGADAEDAELLVGALLLAAGSPGNKLKSFGLLLPPVGVGGADASN